MEELSISEQVSKFLEENAGAYTTTMVREGVHRIQTTTVYFILIRFEKEGKVVRDRVAGRILWTWKDHVPKNMTVREYMLAFYDGELETEIRAQDVYTARRTVRGYTIAGMRPEILSSEVVAKIYKIRYRWPESARETIITEERRLEEQAKRRREERDT